MSRLFGTDGIRGVAGVDITPELTGAVARAAVEVLAGSPGQPLVVIGRDPRPSGRQLAEAAIEGLTGAGADVVDLGILPTPAVAHAVATGAATDGRLADFGVVISASHNPVTDNGIKFFGAGGSKLPVDVEDFIESRLGRSRPATRPGQLRRLERLDWYADHLLAVAATLGRLDGLRVVVDCANGAAAVLAADVYARAGADVIVINDDLTGEHINAECGATHLGSLQRAVVEHGADAGIAHDGDADRCLAVDATGAVVDGDAILAILALRLNDRGELPGRAVAATVMSNQALVLALGSAGIEVRRTDVGDRAVLTRMIADDLALGGEQSGHIIWRDHATTGDGLLTGLALLGAVSASGRSLADLAGVVAPLPQVLLNVRVADKAAALAAAAEVTAAVEAELGAAGRVLVRPSGTEPLLRVMVEATSHATAREAAARIAASVGPVPS